MPEEKDVSLNVYVRKMSKEDVFDVMTFFHDQNIPYSITVDDAVVYEDSDD